MTSEKQIEANRRNAQESTGPKTAEGKAVAKFNAVRHGILSEAVLITKGEGEERKEVYQRLYHGLREYFLPEGAMEEALVEQIAVTLWRKRRVLRFELGCLRKQLDAYQEAAKGPEDDDEDFPLRKHKTAYRRLVEAQERLAHNQQEKKYLQEGYDIMSDEEVENWEDSYFRLAEKKGYEAEDPAKVRDWLKEQGLSEDQIRQELIQVHDELIQQARAEIKTLEPQAALELERMSLLGSVPAFGPDLDKIIRYEASLDRQLYKAISQLERLQRRRKGEELPAPVVLEET
ncbi:MAG: hypothetical protein NC819_02100 [Candidatus Omnitrophica bacterium]|nr:hypothetical protein [Candidatus Omnitrophota bacterium]